MDAMNEPEDIIIDELKDFVEQDDLALERDSQIREDPASELATLISAAGFLTRDKKDFIRGEYCYESIARMEYLLKTDMLNENDRPIFRKCGEYKIVSKILIPMFKSLQRDLQKVDMDIENSKKGNQLYRMIQIIIKMLVRLTLPLPKYGFKNMEYLHFQQEYKNSLIDNDFLHFCVTLIFEPLTLEADERTEMQNDRLELYLCLFKNILAIPNPSTSESVIGISNHFENLHDRAILAFMTEQIMDIINNLASDSPDEIEKIVYLLLDIFYHFFRLENAEAMCGNSNNSNNSNDTLTTTARGNTNSNTNNNTNSNTGGIDGRRARNPRVGRGGRSGRSGRNGRGVGSIRNNTRPRRRNNRWGGVIKKQLIGGQSVIQTSGNKNKLATDNIRGRRKAARFRPKKEKMKRYYMSDDIRNALIYVSDKFLQTSFEALMSVMFDNFQSIPEYEINSSPELRKWFRLAGLMLEYHRMRSRILAVERQGSSTQVSNYNDIVHWYSGDKIKFLLKQETINFIILRMESLFENRKIKHLGIESEQIEETFFVFKEIIRALYNMVHYGNEENKRRGLDIFNHLFYHQKGLELINDVLREYKAHENTKHFLATCVESVHYIMTLVQDSCQQGNNITVKKGTKTAKKSSKKRSKIKKTTNKDENNKESKENKNNKDTIEIAGMEIEELDLDWEMGLNDDNNNDNNNNNNENEIGSDNGHESDIGVDFDFERFLEMFAANKIVHQYLYLLQDYATNSLKLNSYILSLFNKLAFTLKLEPLFYQLSTFILFEKILSDYRIKGNRNYNSLRKFCIKILESFFQRSETNTMLFVDILFYKQRGIIDDIINPGTLFQARKEKEFKKLELERKREMRRNKQQEQGSANEERDIWDSASNSESDGELGYNFEQMAPWTPEEDNILVQYYEKYRDQLNVCEILQSMLNKELVNKVQEAAQDDSQGDGNNSNNGNNGNSNHEAEAQAAQVNASQQANVQEEQNQHEKQEQGSGNNDDEKNGVGEIQMVDSNGMAKEKRNENENENENKNDSENKTENINSNRNDGSNDVVINNDDNKQNGMSESRLHVDSNANENEKEQDNEEGNRKLIKSGKREIDDDSDNDNENGNENDSNMNANNVVNGDGKIKNKKYVERTVRSIRQRLKHLGLLTQNALTRMKNKTKRKNANNSKNNKKNQFASKKRPKAMRLTFSQRKSIVLRSIYDACFGQTSNLETNDNEKENDDDNDSNKNENDNSGSRETEKQKKHKQAFKWLFDKLTSVNDMVSEVLLMEGETKLKQDIAIVPMLRAEFDYFEMVCVKEFLSKLGFLAPNKGLGTCWWRIPIEFKRQDMQDILDFMDQALKLEKNCNIDQLCENDVDLNNVNDLDGINGENGDSDDLDMGFGLYNEEEEENEYKPRKRRLTKGKRQRRERNDMIDVSDDDEDDGILDTIESDSDNNGVLKRKRKRKRKKRERSGENTDRKRERRKSKDESSGEKKSESKSKGKKKHKKFKITKLAEMDDNIENLSDDDIIDDSILFRVASECKDDIDKHANENENENDKENDNNINLLNNEKEIEQNKNETDDSNGENNEQEESDNSKSDQDKKEGKRSRHKSSLSSRSKDKSRRHRKRTRRDLDMDDGGDDNVHSDEDSKFEENNDNKDQVSDDDDEPKRKKRRILRKSKKKDVDQSTNENSKSEEENFFSDLITDDLCEMQLDMKQNNDSNNMMNGDDGDDNTEIESSSSDDEQSKMKKRDKMKMQRSSRISQASNQIGSDSDSD